MRNALAAICCVFALISLGQSASSQPAAPDLNGFWTHGFSLGFDPPPEGGVGPVVDIKGKAAMRAMGQFVIHEGDSTHPALMPWVAAAVKKRSEDEKRGIHTATKQEICFPSGVPNYWTHPLMMQVVQTKDYVVFLHARDHQVRIIHLNKPHAVNPTPSWYGDSVGHFEGDTLVVDTIGLNDKTPVDIFMTPHTDKEHVVERIRVVQGPDGRKNLQVRFTIDDPGAFTMPWTGAETYTSAGTNGTLEEEVCAENNIVIGIPDVPIPTENFVKIP